MPDHWDVFISHASEDKESFVRPLAEALESFGVKVWYDEFTLSLGDSLSRSIDLGLSRSRFGVVVLSSSFFAKGWAEYELRGLVANELDRAKVILPLWYKVTRREVLSYSPPLADKFAIMATDLSPLKVAVEVTRVVRPDIFERLIRRLVYLHSVARGEKVTIDAKELRMPPPRHEKLPADLVSRIRLIRAALLGAYPHSMAFWVDGFRGDAHPTREIRVWERTAACYLEYVQMATLTKEQCAAAFGVLAALSVGADEEALEKEAIDLPSGGVEVLRELYSRSVPTYEVDDGGFPSEYSGNPEDLADLAAYDQENFPEDLPDDLLAKLLEND